MLCTAGYVPLHAGCRDPEANTASHPAVLLYRCVHVTRGRQDRLQAAAGRRTHKDRLKKGAGDGGRCAAPPPKGAMPNEIAEGRAQRGRVQQQRWGTGAAAGGSEHGSQAARNCNTRRRAALAWREAVQRWSGRGGGAGIGMPGLPEAQISTHTPALLRHAPTLLVLDWAFQAAAGKLAHNRLICGSSGGAGGTDRSEWLLRGSRPASQLPLCRCPSTASVAQSRQPPPSSHPKLLHQNYCR